MEHLAQCANCREVVALSIPQLEATSLVATVRDSSRWLSWPVLRWGALAVCVIVVGAAVTLRHPKPESSQPSILARQSGAPAEGKPAVEAPNVANGNGLTAKLASPRPPEASSDVTVWAPAKRLAKSTTASGSPGAESVLAKAAKSAEPKSTDSSLAEMADARPAETFELVPGRAKDALEEPQTAGARDATVGGPVEDAAAVPQATNEALLRATPNLVPRWTLSADGTLQRSLDSGRTWTTIPVSDRTIFRALAASGLDIWVGGSGGALYHSSDAGEHWMRVQPAANGESLTADIIGVEFTDVLHGKLTTSSQDVWTTADSGQTWQKQ
jgi:hypothetical protein